MLAIQPQARADRAALSVPVDSIEHVFECGQAAMLIDEIGEASRAESAAVARRLAAVGQLDAIRTVELAECRFWRTDPFEEVCGEIAAAQCISRGRAGKQVYLARALRDDLPAVARIFASGAIDFAMVETIVARTQNVAPESMPRVDAAVARHCVKWMRLSKPKLRDRVDMWVAKYDPNGVRVPPAVDDSRHVEVFESGPGMAGISAHVHAEAGAVFDAALDALVATVCPNDPRTIEQRRADALVPLGRREATMACLCESSDCAAAAECTALSNVVINVLAEQGTLDGSSDAPGYLPGFGVMPAESVRDLAAAGATVKPLTIAKESAPGYRPTAAQSAFIKWRDLTCRFPGCDAPAQVCDIDHTEPYPYGPTHPSNNKLYCRAHHLLKTFYSGFGWQDRQFPDGTVAWTAPTGHNYSTQAHGGALFPALAQPTGDLGELSVPDESPYRDTMMPTRRQTREQDRQDRITKERRERQDLNAEDDKRKYAAWRATNCEPPPF
jgi:uncharacterized protein DUF222